MRRDKYDLAVTNIGWIETGDAPAQPTLSIQETATSACLHQRLQQPDSTVFDADEIDVTFRLQSAGNDADNMGVLAVSNNLTGDIVLETSTAAAPVQDFVRAVRRYADATGRNNSYILRLWTNKRLSITFEKQVFLVYGSDGTLLRHHSLIPNGIEL